MLLTDIERNFLIKASDILGHTTNGLTGGKIISAFNRYALDFNVGIPHDTIPFEAQNKRTAFLENLEKFKPEHQYRIIEELCEHPNLPNLDDSEIQNLKVQLIARFSSEFGSASFKTLNLRLVEQKKHFLDNYPKSLESYNSALIKFEERRYRRNQLDDLRLSLELLLKDVFKNRKSFENQIPEIGGFIKKNGGSTEFTNMFKKLVDYFSHYQNTFIKHNDSVIEEEVEFIFEMTSSFMKHIVKMKEKTK